MFKQILKTATEIVVSAGASTIVSTVVKQAMPDNLSRYKKITVVAGTVALSGAAAGVASKYATEQIDAAFTLIEVSKEVKRQVGEKIKETTENQQVVINNDGVHVEDTSTDKTEEA